MLKKITAMVLALVLFVSVFAGCDVSSGDNDVKKIGDTKSRKPLRICIDINYGAYSYDQHNKTADLNDFIFSLKEAGGLENFVLEVIPESGAERDAAITRIRTELMSGDGPDVFIANCPYNTDYAEALFPYPEKVMEAGLFLPLDAYMESSTELTDWDQMQPVVLAAGRNKEGQQIIPLSYAFPVRTCQAADFSLEMPEQPISWHDTLNDPNLAAVYAPLNDCIELAYGQQPNGELGYIAVYNRYLEYVLGKLANFEKEELLFTEEELLQRVQEILAMEETDTFTEIYGAEELEGISCHELSERHFNKPMTMIPLYSDDGGVTVTIQNYAAINRNTKRPEDAYAVIDLLMSKKMQKDSEFFTGLLYGGYGLPLHEELGTEESPYNFFNYYMTDANHQAFSEVRDQITNANYDGELVSLLNTMFSMCHQPEFCDMTVEEIVHEAYVDMQRRVKE